ncbi:MAG TPA: hypothetical protein VNY24_19810 [Candidatus Acidoferrales bacterium]|jgi:hypothetical protein|nr:hypothetical protein [Candidatus Acidoferrales bacterium]
MFESICIGRHDFFRGPVDFGQLAEALVFYQVVHFVADQNAFKSLVRTCGADAVLELCEMGSLQIHFSENTPAIVTPNTGAPLEMHGLVTVKVRNENFLTFATKFFEEYVGPSGKGFNRTLRKFLKTVNPYEVTRSALDHVRADLTDQEYLRASVKGILSSIVPEYEPPSPVRFDAKLLSDGHFEIETNIDFVAANEAHRTHNHVPDSILTKADILAQLLTTRTTLEMASGLSADIALGPVSSVIGANKLASVIKTHEKNKDARERFTEWTVEDSRAIAETVRSGNRNFLEVLTLVQKSRQFKDWLKQQDPSADLCKEYCREVSRLDWAEKLPPKSLRWLLVNGAGLVAGAVASPVAGAAASVGIAAADGFLLDKVLKGWRPNQFIEGPLKKFIGIE